MCNIPFINFLLAFYFINNVVPKQVLGVVLSLTTVNGEAAISVTWAAPVDDVAIDRYEVMYKVMGHTTAGSKNTSANETVILTNLVKRAEYSVFVRAVSMEGGYAGEYSTVKSIIAPSGE